MICPTCKDPLDERRTAKYEVVLVCLGSCGTRWSLFDYKLATPS